MNTLTIILAVVVALVVLVLIAGRAGLLKGRAPQLGVHDGRLKPPKRTPNSVSSQAMLYPDAPQRDNARIDPFAVRGDGVSSLDRLRAIVGAMPGAQIVVS